jgi:excisionase family DNA binding protein
MADRSSPETPALRPLLVTPVQAAGMLGVGRTTLYYLTRDRELTAIRIGRATRYAVEELEAYVRERLETGVAGATRRAG